MFNLTKLAHNISELLKAKKNIILVGPSDCGKTWFVQHALIPYLQEQGLDVLYFENCDKISDEIATSIDAIIVDEIEILQDQDNLQKLHPNEKPYYTPEYLDKVSMWQKKLINIDASGLFIVSREKEATPYMLEHVRFLEWNNHPCEVIEFTRDIKKTN